MPLLPAISGGKFKSMHSHAPAQSSQAPEILKKAIFVTALFMGLEFLGGWFANSLALIGDATHMLTDVGALSLSLFAAWLARRPASPKMSFGYERAEILVALLSGLLIWFLTGMLLIEAFGRLMNPPSIQGPTVIIVAAIGLGVNIYCMRLLQPMSGGNLNMRAAYLHVIGDLIGSVGALIAGVVAWRTGWFLVDPLVTFLLCGLLLVSSWKLVREAVGVLMESAPRGINPEAVKADLESLPEVEAVHDLHIWCVTSGRPALSVHVISRQENALERANAVLESKHQIHHTTIQVEHPERFDSARCFSCGPS